MTRDELIRAFPNPDVAKNGPVTVAWVVDRLIEQGLIEVDKQPPPAEVFARFRRDGGTGLLNVRPFEWSVSDEWYEGGVYVPKPPEGSAVLTPDVVKDVTWWLFDNDLDAKPHSTAAHLFGLRDALRAAHGGAS